MQRITHKQLKIAGLSIIGIIIFLILFGLTLFLAVYYGAADKIPTKASLLDISNEEASIVYSSDNAIIGKYFAENRTNIRQEEIPEHLKNALVATEDKRFFSHRGYDTRSYFRVIVKSIFLGNSFSGGGSTITQQLAKNLFGRKKYKFMSMPVNKIKEIIIATRLEDIYSKNELLLLYFNSVPFGEDVYGIESASQRYFNKSTKDLKIEEAATLVGMLKANTYYNPHKNTENSFTRRNIVLQLMGNENYISKAQADSIQKIPLKPDYENLSIDAPAGYFVEQVKFKTQEILQEVNYKRKKNYDLEKDGLKIYTTLNYKIQKTAIEASRSHLGKMQKLLDKELKTRKYKDSFYKNQIKLSKNKEKDNELRKVNIFDQDGVKTIEITKYDSLWHYHKMLNASILITNPKTGAILSWVGGNHFKTMPFDMVNTHRQIASTFKPILYATALEQGISPDTYLENEEKEYPEYQNWHPQNANHKSTPDSTVALWYALANSMNLPAVDLYFKLAQNSVLEMCLKLKFPEIPEETPSIAIGTLDISLYEIVRAFGALAAVGKMHEPFFITKITDAQGNILYIKEKTEPDDIFSIETTQTITAMLQQVVEQGTGNKIRSVYGIKSELAAKTGTAQNYSDAWFMAYSPNIVVGTWVGARSPELHFNNGNGSGSALALPIAAQILKKLENDNSLRKKYLPQFEYPIEMYSFLQNPPYKQKGIKGFFNRIFDNMHNTDEETQIQ